MSRIIKLRSSDNCEKIEVREEGGLNECYK